MSGITYCEVLRKRMKAKLDAGDPRAWWVEALDRLDKEISRYASTRFRLPGS